MSGAIAAYVEALGRELSFDRALARRVCAETEDHLREAAETDPAWPAEEAERRAVARFGSWRDIAAQFTENAVHRQANRTWLILLTAVFATFLAMRLRVMWLEGGDDAVSFLAPLIDRYAFAAATAVAAIGWWVARRSVLPLAFCIAALAASIAAGLVRADLLARPAPVHVLAGTACEIALVLMLAFFVFDLYRGRRRVEILRRPG